MEPSDLDLRFSDMINFRDEEQPFFIYRHCKADTGVPFYIGLGRKKNKKTFGLIYARAFTASQRTNFWKSVSKKHGYFVEIVLDNLTEAEAKQKETELISLYKRRDPDGGILVNLTAGGDGVRWYKPSKEAVEKMKAGLTKTIEDQISKYVDFEPNTGCWIWGGASYDNRPVICYGGKTRLCKRAIYEHYISKIAKTKSAYNHCGIESCVNPYHMKVLSNVEAGTRNPNKGEYRYNTTLKTNQVFEIKRLFNTGVSRKELAIRFKVNKPVIKNIIAGKSWKHVNAS